MPLDGSTYNEFVADEKPVEKTIDPKIVQDAIATVMKTEWHKNDFLQSYIDQVGLFMQAQLQSTMFYGIDWAHDGFTRTADASYATPTQKEIDAAAARALRAARDLIKHPINWTKGQIQRDTCLGRSYCSVGAISKAANVEAMAVGADVYQRACYFLAKAAGIRGGGNAIPNWNDCHARTHAEVIAAFNRAIHLAEGGK